MTSRKLAPCAVAAPAQVRNSTLTSAGLGTGVIARNKFESGFGNSTTYVMAAAQGAWDAAAPLIVPLLPTSASVNSTDVGSYSAAGALTVYEPGVYKFSLFAPVAFYIPTASTLANPSFHFQLLPAQAQAGAFPAFQYLPAGDPASAGAQQSVVVVAYLELTEATVGLTVSPTFILKATANAGGTFAVEEGSTTLTVTRIIH